MHELLRKRWKNAAQTGLAALLGYRCAGCAQRSRALVCGPCVAQLPGAKRLRCLVCARSLGSGAICGACLHHPPAFDASFTSFDYAAPADELIKRLKFGQMVGLADWFAVHMAKQLPNDLDAALIMPVPLAASRLRARGFNQAWHLARGVAQCLKQCGRPAPPLDWKIARRIIDTPALAQLGMAARRSQIRGAFSIVAPQKIKGQSILLVDDVMTTGATMHELARTLKRAGAARVSCLLACRTV